MIEEGGGVYKKKKGEGKIRYYKVVGNGLRAPLNY
jgi:hypothetical protein